MCGRVKFQAMSEADKEWWMVMRVMIRKNVISWVMVHVMRIESGNTAAWRHSSVTHIVSKHS